MITDNTILLLNFIENKKIEDMKFFPIHIDLCHGTFEEYIIDNSSNTRYILHESLNKSFIQTKQLSKMFVMSKSHYLYNAKIKIALRGYWTLHLLKKDHK